MGSLHLFCSAAVALRPGYRQSNCRWTIWRDSTREMVLC